MEEKEKSVATAMYNYFLETLKGKETFEGKHHFFEACERILISLH